jgi:hypothetical protein
LTEGVVEVAFLANLVEEGETRESLAAERFGDGFRLPT